MRATCSLAAFRLRSSYSRLAGNNASYREPKPTILKRQPGIIERRHNWSAFLTSSIDDPPIDPDRSTTKTTSAGTESVPNDGENAMAIACVLSSGLRSIQACGVSRPAAWTLSTKSRSSAASRCDRVTVAVRPAIVTDTGCEGDSICEIAPGMARRTVRLSPYGTCQSLGGFSVWLSGRPTPT